VSFVLFRFYQCYLAVEAQRNQREHQHLAKLTGILKIRKKNKATINNELEFDAS